MEKLNQIKEALEEDPHHSDARKLISLLYHRDWYIRREVAFMIDKFGIKLNEEERNQYWFALQDFERFDDRKDYDPAARALLFAACKDPSPKIRVKALSYLSLIDCRNKQEEVLLFYAAADYANLVELASQEEYKTEIIAILEYGMNQSDNPAYHRKQCALCLEQLHAMEDSQRFIEEVLYSSNRPFISEGQPPLTISPSDPLMHLITHLKLQGILVDGAVLYPDIKIGTITNRIIYSNPPLQTWPEEVRDKKIQASSGKKILKFDYKTIEPTLLLHFLLFHFFLSFEDIPTGDIYLALDPENRSRGKNWFLKVIYDERDVPLTNLSAFQRKLLIAVKEFRQDLLIKVQKHEYVETIGGKYIPLSANEPNSGGKALNRLLQGSASDIFNYSIVKLHQFLVDENLPARIMFLLFDEVWIEIDLHSSSDLCNSIIDILLQVNHEFCLLKPLEIRIRE